MSDNSAHAHVLSNVFVDVLDTQTTVPLRKLEPISAKDIKLSFARKADAINLARKLEKQYQGEWFIVHPLEQGYELANYDSLPLEIQAWADEERKFESYYE